MVSRAFRNARALVAGPQGFLYVNNGFVSHRDPLDPFLGNRFAFWKADPWAEVIGIQAADGFNLMEHDLKSEELVYLRNPRQAPTKNSSDWLSEFIGHPKSQDASDTENGYVGPLDQPLDMDSSAVNSEKQIPAAGERLSQAVTKRMVWPNNMGLPPVETYKRLRETTFSVEVANSNTGVSLNGNRNGRMRLKRNKRASVHNVRTALYNNEVHQKLNKFEVRPMFHFGNSIPARERLTEGVWQFPVDSDPTLTLRAFMPGGAVKLLGGTCYEETIQVHSWAYEYFDWRQPGALYLGPDAHYVWYPKEVANEDVPFYQTYLSVVSRIDYIERLIRKPGLPVDICNALVSVQDSFIELTEFMMANDMYTDRELLCPMPLGETVAKVPFTMPSGENITLKIGTTNAGRVQSCADLRALTYQVRAMGDLIGMNWKDIPKDGSFLAEFGPDYAYVWHMGLLPNLSMYVEFLGIPNERERQDWPYDDKEFVAMVGFLKKAAWIPLSRRDWSGLLWSIIKLYPLIYSVLYKMVIASLGGYYRNKHNASGEPTSFYVRAAVYRNFIINECPQEDFLSWLNAQETTRQTFLGTELFHRQYTMTTLLNEYMVWLMSMLPYLKDYMDENFYGRTLTRNITDTMNEYRATMTASLFGFGNEWERFQGNHERYAKVLYDKQSRSILNKCSIPYTEYDNHFINLSGCKYDQSRFLSEAYMSCAIRALMESMRNRPHLFDAARLRLMRRYLEVPVLWACRNWRESAGDKGEQREDAEKSYIMMVDIAAASNGHIYDTVESIAEGVLSKRLSVHVAVSAYAIRASLLLVPDNLQDNHKEHLRNLMEGLFCTVLRQEYHKKYGKRPWRLLRRNSFEDMLAVYCGPLHTVSTDFREEFKDAHGISMVYGYGPCICQYCLAEPQNRKTAGYNAYRKLQDLHRDNSLAQFFFGHRITHIGETMFCMAYQHRLDFMYRPAKVSFTQFMVMQMEIIMLPLSKDPRMMRMKEAITETERRFIATIVASCNLNELGLTFLLDPPLRIQKRNLWTLLQIKNLYTSHTYPSHVYNALLDMANSSCRDFLIIYLVFNERLIRLSTRFFSLPPDWTEGQIDALRKKYSSVFEPAGQPFSCRVGEFFYCPIHGDFKRPVITRTRGELREFNAQFRDSIGVTNSALEVSTEKIYCRCSVITGSRQREGSSSVLPGVNTDGMRHVYDSANIFGPEFDEGQNAEAGGEEGDYVPASSKKKGQFTAILPVVGALEDFDGTATIKEKLTSKGKVRRSKKTRLSSVHNMCTMPNLRVNMIGVMLVNNRRRIMLCPRCATPMVYNRHSCDAFGANCGQCTLAEARLLPTNLSDFLRFQCVLCKDGSKLYPAKSVDCYSVIDDSVAGCRTRTDVYLCPEHSKIEHIDRYMPKFTLGMLKRALDCKLVLVERNKDTGAVLFGLRICHTIFWEQHNKRAEEHRRRADLRKFEFALRIRVEIPKEVTDLDEYSDFNRVRLNPETDLLCD